MYRDDPENIIGVVHAKNLLRAMYALMEDPETAVAALQDFNISDVAIEPYFVPDTTALDDQRANHHRTHCKFRS